MIVETTLKNALKYKIYENIMLIDNNEKCTMF